MAMGRRRAPRRATCDNETGASAAQRRVQAGASERRTAALAAPAGRTRATQPCREGGEVSACANAPSSSTAVAQRATADARPTTPACALVRDAAVPSGGAIGVWIRWLSRCPGRLYSPARILGLNSGTLLLHER